MGGTVEEAALLHPPQQEEYLRMTDVLVGGTVEEAVLLHPLSRRNT